MSWLKHWFSRRGALPLTCYLAAALLWAASALVRRTRWRMPGGA